MPSSTRQSTSGSSGNLHPLDTGPMLSLTDIFGTLSGWWKFIVLITLCIGALSFSLAGARERVYEAEVSVLIDPRGIQVLDRELTPRIQSADGNIALIESMMRIMTSDRILAAVVDKENLIADREFNGVGAYSIITNLKNIVLGGSGPTSNDRRIVTTHNFRKAVGIARPKLSYVVELGVASKDPQKAARLANSIAEIFLLSEQAAHSEVAQRAADSLSGRIDDLKVQLNTAENAVERYKLENNILNATGGLINEQELSQVNKALVEARDRTTAARVMYEGIKKLRTSGALPQTLPAEIKSQTIANLRLELSRATQRKIGFSAQYLDTHPVMKAEELRIKDVQQSIYDELDRIASAAQVQYNSALGLEKELRAKVTNLANKTYSTNDAKVKLRELQREVDSKRVIYEAFLVRSKELGEQVRVDTSRARIVSPAIPPIKPAGLPSSVLAIAGTGAGFGFACALALLGSTVFPSTSSSPRRKSKRIETSPSRSSRVGSQINGVLHRKNSNRVGESVANDDAMGETPFKLPVLLSFTMARNNLVGDRIPVLFDEEHGDHVAQEFKHVVEAVAKSFKLKRARTVLVTGFEDSFGKSAFASNLALAAGQAGYNVVVAGADVENAGAVHEFSKIAESQLDAASSYKLAVGQNVAGMPMAGRFQHWPLGLSGATNRLHKMVRLEKLKDRLANPKFRTDFAVIDGPLLDDDPDITNFSTLADEVIIVLPQGAIPGGSSHQLLSKLGGKRSRIRGVVKVAYTV